MRILVTGATGLLGSDLTRLLCRDYEMIGWARRIKPPSSASPVVLESVDLTDPERVRSGLRQWRPQVVLNAAALADVDACERDPEACRAVNRDAVETLARGCDEVGAFLIAFSTDYVFDGTKGASYLEEDAPHPVNLYGRIKREGEERALAAERCLVVRVSGLFGLGRPNFGWGSVQQLRAGQTVRATTDQRNCPSYTADVAQGVRRLLEIFKRDPSSAEPSGALHGVLHLANSGGATRWEVAIEIARLLSVSPSRVQQVDWQTLGRPARRPPDTRLDCNRFAQLTGIPLRSWQQALKEFVTSPS